MNIAVLTATRAEYGLLKPILTELENDSTFNLQILVTGAHLSPEFGLTYKEIESDGFFIHKKVEMLLSSDTAVSISKSMGLALIGFAEYFSEQRPDLLLVLGDRYETLATALAAMNENIPIIHLYGGEKTEGAVDESIRHALTKLSYLHFTSTEEYKNRVIQLGEHPDRVKAVGGLGVENIQKEKLLTKEEFLTDINMNHNQSYAMVTFHPVTLEEGENVEIQIKALLKAMSDYPQIQFLITKANADAHGRIINQLVDDYVDKHPHAKAFTSLGMKRYLSGLKHASFVLGNSSSGILEAPSFGIPTINIGDRQKGRIQSDSVINCIPEYKSISQAIEKAITSDFQALASQTQNPYGDGKTSEKIMNVLRDIKQDNLLDLKKSFYDVGEFYE